MLWVNSFLSATSLNGKMFFLDLGKLHQWADYSCLIPYLLVQQIWSPFPLLWKTNNSRMGFGHLILLLHVRKGASDLFDACLWVTTQEWLQFCLVRLFSLAHLTSFPSTRIWWFFGCCFFCFVFWGVGVCVCMFVCWTREIHPRVSVCEDATSDFKGW